MTDNYRDEMREARENVRKIGLYAMDMPPGKSRDWLEQELRSLDAALSRLSASEKVSRAYGEGRADPLDEQAREAARQVRLLLDDQLPAPEEGTK